MHFGEKYKCTLCGRSFSTNHILKKHENAIHKNNDNHECEICHKEFSEIELLKCHFEWNHQGLEAKNKCEICEKLFVRSSELNNHILIHQKPIQNKLEKCDKCEKIFSSTQYLKVHVRRVHTIQGDEICSK